MKNILTILFLVYQVVVYGQSYENSSRFTKQEFEEDFEFIKTKILNAHANPFTIITENEFDSICYNIKSQFSDNLPLSKFNSLIKPLFEMLNDEHAGLDNWSIKNEIQQENSIPQSKQREKKSPISFKKIKDYGYLTVNTFDDNSTFPVEIWKNKIDSVFAHIKKDKIRKLVIDVSDNPGGNSEIGNLLIDYFSNKSYKTYQGKWKKSQEYSDFLLSYGYVDSVYENIKNGDYYPITAEQIHPTKNKNRFNGKTYVIVSKSTFSSALMFGVLVSDNKLATVVGETPENGHPNHFGELIIFKTPNTELEFWFGVKEWIRPAGKIVPNKLVPDRIITLNNKSEEQIIEELR